MVSPPGQLGSDLLLLAIDPRSGRIRARSLLGYGLMASELVELAALGRVRVENDRIVLAQAPAASPSTGDADLDAALTSISSARRPPKPATWVGRPRRHIIDGYLARMSAAGTVARSPGIRARWQILDAAGAATARSTVDALASGSDPADAWQAALGGLTRAVGLDRVLYPGLGDRHMRQRLRQVAKGEWTAAVAGDSAGTAEDSAGMAADQAGMAADQAAINAATVAAVQAATKAAVQAATSAAASAAAASG